MNIQLNLIAVKTIIRKEMMRVLRIWVQTIVPPAITMTLYFIIFGNLTPDLFKNCLNSFTSG